MIDILIHVVRSAGIGAVKGIWRFLIFVRVVKPQSNPFRRWLP